MKKRPVVGEKTGLSREKNYGLVRKRYVAHRGKLTLGLATEIEGVFQVTGLARVKS